MNIPNVTEGQLGQWARNSLLFQDEPFLKDGALPSLSGFLSRNGYDVLAAGIVGFTPVAQTWKKVITIVPGVLLIAAGVVAGLFGVGLLGPSELSVGAGIALVVGSAVAVTIGNALLYYGITNRWPSARDIVLDFIFNLVTAGLGTVIGRLGQVVKLARAVTLAARIANYFIRGIRTAQLTMVVINAASICLTGDYLSVRGRFGAIGWAILLGGALFLGDLPQPYP